MKTRVSLFAVIFLVGFAGSNAFHPNSRNSGADWGPLQDDAQDFFFAPSCGAGGSPDARVEPPPPRVNMETLRRHRISGTLPAYPAAKSAQLRGVVALDVQVDKDGTVSQVKALSGNPVLARAAEQAVGQWKYRPVTVGGHAIAVGGNVLLTFDQAKSPAVREGGEWPFREVACKGDPLGPLYRVAPEYPKIAQLAHVQGDVVLDLVIDKEGKVADLKVVSGHPLLVQAAMDAVKQWRYRPYLVGGEAVAVDGRVTVKFQAPEKPVTPKGEKDAG